VASLCHAQRHLTDGLILYSDLRSLIPEQRPSSRMLRWLERLRLWDRLPDGPVPPDVARKRAGRTPGGHHKNTRSTSRWRIHDYLEYNASASERKARRSKDAERKRTGRSFQAESARSPNGIQTDAPSVSARSPSASPLLSSTEGRGASYTREVTTPPDAAPPTEPAPDLSRDRDGTGRERDRICKICGDTWLGGPRCPKEASHASRPARPVPG
jgi:hypothetical protein